MALDTLWRTDHTIINLEHDLEVADEHLDELLACEHPLCSWTYQCHFASTGQAESIIAAGTGDWAHHLQGGEEWADWSAIGFCKITPAARTGELVCQPWHQVERSVHNAVQRPWHLHGNGTHPSDLSGHVEHHHW